jgi:hypothetical protein
MTGSYVPFGGDPNRKRTDFVEDGSSGRFAGQTDSSYGNFGQGCENTPGLSKNARQIERVGRFIKTKIIGKDDRCPLRYGPDATDADRAMYGTGVIYNVNSVCKDKDKMDLDYCTGRGTGHLVHGTDLVITNAHIFRYGKKNQFQADPRNGFEFYTRVWSPKTKGYVIRHFKIKEVFFGTTDLVRSPEKDYAFLRLEEPVGEVVDGLPVPKKYQIRPLPFKVVDKSKAPNAALTVGYNREISDFSKNCAPFSLTNATNNIRLPENRTDHPENLYFHNGDTISGASGSAIALLDESGKPYYAALNKGWEATLADESNTAMQAGGYGSPEALDKEGVKAGVMNDGATALPNGRDLQPTESADGVNIAINASSFYDSFMDFAQQGPR